MAAILFALGAPGLAHAAQSSAARPPIYRMVWNVEPQGTVGEVHAVRPGEVALTLQLRPPALFRAAHDVRDMAGQVLLPAGIQLVGLQSEARIACTIHQTERRGAEQMLFLGSLKRVCLLDADGDGRFERRFLRSTNGQAFFLLRGRLSDRQQPIEPAELVAQPPAAIEGAPVIEVTLDRSSRADRRVLLTIAVGRAGQGFGLGGRLAANAASLPAAFDLYGGRIEVSPRPDGSFGVRTLARFSARALDFWD